MRNLNNIAKVAIFLALLLLWSFLLLKKTNLGATDLGRHIKNGQLIFSFPQVLFTNFYSYVLPDHPFVNHHWLSGAVFYWIKILFGWKGLSLFAFFLMLGTILMAFYCSVRRSNFWVAAFWAVPSGVLLSERTEIRPELFSTFFIVAYFFLLREFLSGRKRKQAFVILLFLQLIWSNIHIYSFLGLTMIFFAFLQEFYDFLRSRPLGFKAAAGFFRENALLRLFLAACLAALATPNFMRGFFYPFSILNDYGYEIVENKNIFYIQRLMINFNIIVFKALFLSAALVISCSLFLEKKIRVFELLVFLVFSFLGFFALRNIAMFGVAILPIVARSTAVVLGSIGKNKKNLYLKFVGPVLTMGLALFFSVWVFSGSYFSGQGKESDFGLGLDPEGEKMGEFIKSNNISGKIFNNYDIGSYLDYVLAPEQKVFVDNRPEAFGANFFEQYRKMETDVDFWRQQEEKYGFQYVIFSHTDGTPWGRDFSERILCDEKWKMIYLDERSYILAKDNDLEEGIISRLEIKKSDFKNKAGEIFANTNFQGKLAMTDFLLQAGKVDAAENLSRLLTDEFPDNFQARMMSGQVLSFSDDKEKLKEAEKFFLRAIDQGAGLSGVYNNLGLVNAKLGDYLEARRAWERALEINPDDEWSKFYLSSIR